MQLQDYVDLLGYRVRDKVTGFEGVVTSIGFDLYGCVQAVVTPPAKDGKQEDSRWYDTHRLSIEPGERNAIPYSHATTAHDGRRERHETRPRVSRCSARQ